MLALILGTRRNIPSVLIRRTLLLGLIISWCFWGLSRDLRFTARRENVECWELLLIVVGLVFVALISRRAWERGDLMYLCQGSGGVPCVVLAVLVCIFAALVRRIMFSSLVSDFVPYLILVL